MKTSRFKRIVVALFCSAPFLLSTLGAEESYLSEDDLYNEEAATRSEIYDPFEGLNRYIFSFNDFVYLKLLQPVATVYTKVTPDPVEEGAENFFRNLRYPVRLTGNLLQARWEGAWRETKRFAVNTTVGIGGIMAPADDMEGLARIPSEEVGQALGAWGIGEGPYLVLPLLGPSNLRDLVGLFGDAAVHPTREPFSLIDDWDWEWRTAWGGAEFIVASPALINRYKSMMGSAIDPYSSLKNSYTQYRRAAIAE